MLTFLTPKNDSKPARLVFQQKAPEAPQAAPKSKKENKENTDTRLQKALDTMKQAEFVAAETADRLGFNLDLKKPKDIQETGDAEMDKAIQGLVEAAYTVEVSKNSIDLARAASQYINARGTEKAKLRLQILANAKKTGVERGEVFTDRHIGSILVQRSPEGKPDGYMIVLGTGQGSWDTIIVGSAKSADFRMNDTQMRQARKDQLRREANRS